MGGVFPVFCGGGEGGGGGGVGQFPKKIFRQKLRGKNRERSGAMEKRKIKQVL